MAGVAAEFFLEGLWQDELQFSLMRLLEAPTSEQQLRQITVSPLNPEEPDCPGLGSLWGMCLQIAPRLSAGTVYQFWTSVLPHSYEGPQLGRMLEGVVFRSAKRKFGSSSAG